MTTPGIVELNQGHGNSSGGNSLRSSGVPPSMIGVRVSDGARSLPPPLQKAIPGPPLRALHLLIVDDDEPVRRACCEIATQMGFTVFAAEHLTAAEAMLKHQRIDMLLLDLKVPGGNGLGELEAIRTMHPEMGVIVMTAFATVASAVEAMRIGAANYLTKPFSLTELSGTLEAVSQRIALDLESRRLREKMRTQKGVGQLVGRSPEMEKLYRIIAKVAHASHPLLIYGEEGTGKEMVARSIHFNSPHASQPFVPVDCGSLLASSIEGELFGHVKGAFPGAVRANDGLLASADGGTVYLDEVGELPLDMQAKLMRALQDRLVHPIGATEPVPISVRVIAASSRDLNAMMTQGRFRKDLYFRLNVVHLKIPPMRERRQDIPELIQGYLARIDHPIAGRLTFSDDALRLMVAYDWPGNTRELEHAIDSACKNSSGPILHTRDLPSPLQEFLRQSGGRPVTPAVGQVVVGLSHLRAGERAEGRPDFVRRVPEGIVSIAELEKTAILGTIRQLKGDKLMAARLLGIGKTTLYRKLKEYGISEGTDVDA